MKLLRSTLFEIAYWVTTLFFGAICTVLAIVLGKRLLGYGIFSYARVIAFLLRFVAGVRIDLRGTHHLSHIPSVIAAKHQSWGDPLIMVATVRPLAYVAGDHLVKYPLVGFILKKTGAVVLSNQGGEAARARIDEGMRRLQSDRRHILIYPEGHLSAPGEKHPYKKGVFHLAHDLDRPVVPVATSLGLAWDRKAFIKRPRTVVVEFLEPIQPGEDKDAFMLQLEETIEARTAELIRADIGEA
ncbi:lysophospholipid acyltransferase family protein [Glycocaulis sp.]|uniref:lysophospholipid acyltransferase family protein n=1 Tax=Glycocaulis sp. TaxID=1969725 RepID=UPI003F70722B